MKSKILIALFSCKILISYSLFAQTGWFQQTSGVGFNLNSVFFVDANTGYIAADSSGNPRVLKSTDGGSTWIRLAIPPTSTLLTIFFTDVNTGYAGGADAPTASMIKTTNGGVSWVQLNPPGGIYGLHSIYFINSSTGFEVGSAYSSCGSVVRTTDGGTTWTIVTPCMGNILYSVFFADVNTGYACGTPGTILKTTNAGVNWVTQTSSTTANLKSIYFINPLTGWTAGTDSHLYETTNGGTTWSMFYNQSLCGLYSVYFANEQTGWVCGCEGAINSTTNNGASWTLQSFASTTYLYSMSFISASTGWAVGAGGRILKTITGGLTSIQSVSNIIPDKFSLLQNYPNPFNPSTKIKFDIPTVGQRHAFDTRLIIYDILGKEIAILVNEELKSGSYEVNWNAANYPSGIYYYRLVIGDNLHEHAGTNNGVKDNYSETKKMVLIK